MTQQEVRIVLYLNQFFGQVGGEEAAGVAPRLFTGPVGPARALAAVLQPHETLVGTVVCGDNYFVEHEEEAIGTILDLITPLQPTLLLAGPAFNAGRYGQACGAISHAVQARLDIAAVAGMYHENPGVEMYRKRVLIVRSGESAAAMRQGLESMLQLGRDIVHGRPIRRPYEGGYFPRGKPIQEIVDKNAATRSIDMLLAKLVGTPFVSEIELPSFRPADPAPQIADMSQAKLALVTDCGLVLKGDPDGIGGYAATKWGHYSIAGWDRMQPEALMVTGSGCDPRFIEEDPNRAVPLDVLRSLEAEGRIGKIFDEYLATAGVANPMENSRRLGREMGSYLKQAKVDCVILTST